MNRSMAAIFATFLLLFSAWLPAMAETPADADLARLEQVLRDPQARSELLSRIDTLRAEAPVAAEEGDAHPALAAQLPGLETAAQALAEVAERIAGDVAALREAFGKPAVREQILRSAMRIATILLLAALAVLVTSRIVMRLVRTFEDAGARSTLRRIAVGAARGLLELAPPASLVLATYAAIAVIGPARTVRDILIALVLVAASIQTGLAIGRLALRPAEPERGFLPLDGPRARSAYAWIRRIVFAVGLGYAATRIAAIMNASPVVDETIRWTAGVAVAAIAAACVLSNRHAVAHAIGGNVVRDRAAGSAGARLRLALAAVWHLVAIGYIAAALALWGSRIPGGFEYMVRGTAATVLSVVLVQFCLAQIERLFERSRAHLDRLVSRMPPLERRAEAYMRKLRLAAGIAVRIAGAIAVLLAWQVDVAGLAATPAGDFLISRLGAVAGSLLLAYVVWEIADSLIAFQLDRRDAQGRALVSNSRLRTLLPLIRNAILVVIVLLAGLSVLSQLGLNVMPLLAGAGVVGLAIGFGSQTLVKDVITGIFILAEDTVNIGDVAKINGIGGLVEGMTIRTIRLRDLSGVVHTIPFGSINEISNMTKDFSFYLLDIGVAYRESTDRVVGVLREVFATIAADEKFRDDILGELEVLGVDRFEDSAVHILARIRTKPLRQWEIGREFNRRMKMRFDELGIEIPFPQRVVHVVGEPAVATP